MIGPRSIAAVKSGSAAGVPLEALPLLVALLDEDAELAPAELEELACEALLDELPGLEEFETIELLEALEEEFPPTGLACAAGIAESDDVPPQDAARIATRNMPTRRKGMRCTVNPPWNRVLGHPGSKRRAARTCRWRDVRRTKTRQREF